MADIIIEGITATVIGMGMVFGVLTILCIILSFFKYLTPQEKPKSEPKPVEEAAPAEEMPEEEIYDDTELIAVLSAAISAFMEEGSAFAIKSIKPVASAAGVSAYGGWKAAAIRESHRGLY